MAKRKKKEDEEEEYEFDFPEFDKKEYMMEQITKAKSIYVTVAVAPLFSYIALQIYLLADFNFLFGLFVGMFGIVIVRFLFDFVGVDTVEFGKKEWAMNIGLYFFTFLAVWIILMNPPVNDFTHPNVQDFDVTVREAGGNWTALDDANITEGETYDVNITVKVTDNVEVQQVKIESDFRQQGQQLEMKKTGEYRYSYTYSDVPATAGSYHVDITMEDVNGNSNTVVRSFELSP